MWSLFCVVLKRVVLVALLSSWTSALSLSSILDRDIYSFPIGVILTDGQEFDFIVVGAGAGGAASASRLTLAGHDVLLIEAGGDPDVRSKIPAAAMTLLGSNLDWQYKTISNNKSCLASEDKQCRFSRGKCLGGSTSINYMLYTRGNRLVDFKDIPYPGWTFSDLMPYFLRYEGLQDLNELPDSSKPYHNTTGTMKMGFFDDPHNPWHSKLVTAFRSLDFPLNLDLNAESQIGVNQVVGYVHRGERMSTARGYLARNDVKGALKVAKNTKCLSVIIDEQNNARGVNTIQGSRSLKLYARKEVIISAGAIGTPQILMQSGIGPVDHLKSMNIPVKVDLPVGDGMTDHVLPLLIVQVEKDAGLLDDLRLLASTTTQLVELLVLQSGALTSNGLTDINIFGNTHCYNFNDRKLVNESFDGSDCNVPNLQVINAYVERYLLSLVKPIFKQVIGLNDDVIDQLAEANLKYAFIVMSPVLLDPLSVGHVRLASSDPLVPPAIYPNYLADEGDVEEMVRSIGIVEHMVDTLPFKQRNSSLLHLTFPECPDFDADRKGYWRCYVRHMTYAVFHASGTAALGRVLDAELRVIGVNNLRVADLSAVPRVPHGNTAAVAIAIGERVADFVLENE